MCETQVKTEMIFLFQAEENLFLISRRNGVESAKGRLAIYFKALKGPML